MKALGRVVLFVGGSVAERAAEAFRLGTKNIGLPYSARIVREHDIASAALGDVSTVIAFNGIVVDHPRVEIWNEADVEREVNDLVARLLGGKRGSEAPPPPTKPEPAKKVHTVRIAREVAGRRGKGVTMVWDLPMNEAAIKDLAATLKQKCGTGGTVKDGKIEIQGDHRDRIQAELENLGYKVKRSGG